MLDYLHEVEARLPKLLLEPIDTWQSRHVTYEKPHVRRLFRQDGQNRIYLHLIDPCEEHAAFWHKHPWPSAMRILSGRYEMRVGFKEKTAAKLLLGPGDEYEMLDKDAQHSVRPIGGPTLSLMVTGPLYKRRNGTVPVQNPDLKSYDAILLHSLFYNHYITNELYG